MSSESDYVEFFGSARQPVVQTIESSLNELFQETPWSMYGYLKFVQEQMGDRVRYPNVQMSQTLMQKYRDASSDYRTLIPELLRSTHQRLLDLAQSVPSMQKCCEYINDSANPLVLYLLFRAMAVRMPGTFLDDFVAGHTETAREFLRRFPEVKENLNEPYKMLSEELINGATG